MRYPMLSFYTLSPSIFTLVSVLAFHPVSVMGMEEVDDEEKSLKGSLRNPQKASKKGTISPILEEDAEGFLLVSQTQEADALDPLSPNPHPSDISKVLTLADIRHALRYYPQDMLLVGNPPARVGYQRDYVEPLMIKLMKLTGWEVNEAGALSSAYFYVNESSVSKTLQHERARSSSLTGQEALKSKIFIAQLEDLERALKNITRPSSSEELLPSLLPENMQKHGWTSTYLTHPTLLPLFVAPHDIDTMTDVLELLYNAFAKLQRVYSQIKLTSFKAMNPILATRLLSNGNQESTLAAWGKMILEINKTYYAQKASEVQPSSTDAAAASSISNGASNTAPEKSLTSPSFSASPDSLSLGEQDEDGFDWTVLAAALSEEMEARHQNRSHPTSPVLGSLTASSVDLHQELENRALGTPPLTTEAAAKDRFQPVQAETDAERSLTASPVILHQELENRASGTPPLTTEAAAKDGFQPVQDLDADEGLTVSPVAPPQNSESKAAGTPLLTAKTAADDGDAFQLVQDLDADEGLTVSPIDFPQNLDATKTEFSHTVADTADEDGFYHIERAATEATAQKDSPLLDVSEGLTASPVDLHQESEDNRASRTPPPLTIEAGAEDRLYSIGAANLEAIPSLFAADENLASPSVIPHQNSGDNPVAVVLPLTTEAGAKEGLRSITASPEVTLPLLPTNGGNKDSENLRRELEAARAELARLKEEAAQLTQQRLSAETQLSEQDTSQTRQAIEALLSGITAPVEQMIQGFQNEVVEPILRALQELSQDPAYEEHQSTFEEITETLMMLQQKGLNPIQGIIDKFKSSLSSNAAPATQLALAQDFVHKLNNAFKEATEALDLTQKTVFPANSSRPSFGGSDVSPRMQSLPFVLPSQTSMSPSPSYHPTGAPFNISPLGSSSTHSGLTTSTGLSKGASPAIPVGTQIQTLARDSKTLLPPAMKAWQDQMNTRLQMVRSSTTKVRPARSFVKTTRRRIGDEKTGNLLVGVSA